MLVLHSEQASTPKLVYTAILEAVHVNPCFEKSNGIAHCCIISKAWTIETTTLNEFVVQMVWLREYSMRNIDLMWHAFAMSVRWKMKKK